MHINSILKLPILIIESCYKLNLNEQRLVLLALLKSYEKKESTIEITSQEINEIYHIPLSQSYRFLEKVGSSLVNKTSLVSDKGKQENTTFYWFKNLTYHKGKAKLTLTLSDNLVAFLSDKTTKVIFINAKEVMQLTSYYAIRFYLLSMVLKERRDKTVSIEQLKALFCLTSNYARFTNIRARILEPSKKEISDKTSIYFDYEIQKEGTKIISLKFKLKDKIKKPKQPNRCQQTLEMFD